MTAWTKKELEQSLSRALLNSRVDGMIGFDATYKVIEWNKIMELHYGISRDEALTMSLYEAFPEFDYPEGKGLLEQVLKGESFYLKDKKYKYRNGFYEAHITPIHNGSKEVIGGFITLHDITEVKQILEKLRVQNQQLISTNSLLQKEIAERQNAEKQLKQAHDHLEKRVKERTEELSKAKLEAENASREKDKFLANMSHEIRTPMNAIIGMAQMLRHTPLTEEQTKFVNSINFASDSLLSLINDILDFSKIEAGMLEFEKKSFSLQTLVDQIMNVTSFKGEVNQNIHLEKSISSEVPSAICGDKYRLNQILLNLLSNAVKFTHEGKISLNVSVADKSDKNIILKFTVTDTGIGIPKNKLKTIFEGFTQASSDTTRKYGGTGLGLAIVKSLVELQGGKVNVKSQEGEGSEFSFTLPFMVEGAASETRPRKGNGVKSLQKIRILVAEDNELNQFLIQSLLSKFKASVEIAKDGLQALDMLHKNDYDVILMDIQMPNMDGYEATKKIRSTFEGEKQKVPIIAMTAHALVGEKEKCIGVGMNNYITKPIKIDELLDSIDQVLK